ncbi:MULTISPECIES: hypothetical protein [unclassified Streptomyces]|uniref:hypothetical protein n=1 Tax=unclassified Streptomyces TaxID=2593676 RepID=UPI00403C636A
MADMQEPWGIPTDIQRLRGHAERAFVEVQRADTKATALCGIAGGLLAAGVAVLSSTDVLPSIGVFSLLLTCLLLLFAIGAALLVLRPVVPGAGLRAELMAEAVVHLRFGVSAAAHGELERHVEARRLRVLAWLADRKLRTVRLAVDFSLAALLMAGICLLSCFLVN